MVHQLKLPESSLLVSVSVSISFSDTSSSKVPTSVGVRGRVRCVIFALIGSP